MAFDANDLSPHEHFVVERTRLGEIADFSPLGGADGAKPGLRAGFLRKLLLELEPEWRLKPPGVRIKGARIDGALDLTDCSGRALPALTLEACDAPEPLSFARARIARLALIGCSLRHIDVVSARVECDLDLRACVPNGAAGAEMLRIDGRDVRVGGALRLTGARLSRGDENGDALMLDGAATEGDVLLDEGFEAFGRISLAHARIGGSLVCDGAAFLNRADDASAAALHAPHLHIAANARLGARFKAEGELNLTGAHIGGDALFTGASLRNDFGGALTLSGAHIRGQLRLGAKVAGQVLIDGVKVGRTLDLRGAEIAHPLTPRAGRFGVAVDAERARIAGAAQFEGANIKGETRLSGAEIGASLNFGSGRFINGGGEAIAAEGVRVAGSVSFAIKDGFAPHGQRTVVEGCANFTRAKIGGALAWRALELRGASPAGDKGGALSIAGARIEGALEAAALTSHPGARIDMRGAHCAALHDDAKSGWGGDGTTLSLEGFLYERIAAEERWRTRLAWLKRSGAGYEAYAQAARAYARAGRAGEAQRLLLAGRDRGARRNASGPLGWALSSLYGLIAGYGLSPVRMLRAIAIYLALGVFGVLAMNAQGGLVTAQGRACNGAVEPAIYALDIALPLIDLGQAGRCAPGRTARADMPAGVAVGEDGWRLFEGAALWRWAHALYAIAGAILAALAALTFSGVMRPRPG